LNYVRDNVSATQYTVDIDNQSVNNYAYDSTGNLIKDNLESITNVVWSVYGKILQITRTATSSNPVTDIQYTYDASGNRISKRVQKGNTSVDYTWYVRDAQSNVMAVYTSTGKGTNYASLPLTLIEQHIYGSSRLGIVSRSVNMKTAFTPPALLSFIRGFKNYELINHLGNVLVTVSDKKKGHNAGNGIIDFYIADVISADDYYPGGMIMPGRKFSASSLYRYGFNGKENDNDVKGEGNQQDYGMRIYDPRLGKFLSVDPLTKDYPSWSPYPFAMNSPTSGVDLDGLEYYYSADGRFLGNIGTSQDVYRADRLSSQEVDCGDGTKGWELKPVNPVNLNITHDKFQRSANVVLQEGLSQDSKEYLWVAHTNNNNAKAQKESFSDLILSDYSSVKDKSPLSDKIKEKNKNYYNRAKYARASVIDVLSGNPDPTGGAMFWDGVDFLAWGWNSPNGTPQNKMEEYKSITISKAIYDEFLKNSKVAYPHGYNYNTAKKGKPKKYFHSDIPNCVFELPEYWTNGYFYYNVQLKKPYGIEATGTAGNSIFWKLNK
jgi:RHS repeat-associated protein